MDNPSWLLNTCPECDNPHVKPRANLEINTKKYPGKGYCPKCDSFWEVTKTPAQPEVGL